MNFLSVLFTSLPMEWAQYTFMHNAFYAVVLITPILAILGCLVINNQMAFFSDALGHAALSGIALGTLLGLMNPILAMIAFSIVFVGIVTIFRRYSSASTDTVLGLMSSFSVALGIVILSRNGGFTKFGRYLIGDILTITPTELLWLLSTVLIAIIVLLFFYNRFLLISINRPLAQSRGISAWKVEFFFSLLVALVVTIALPWIGLLVVNSLLILPAAAARNIARSNASYVWIAILVGIVSGLIGLISSYYLNSATGATIVLIAMIFFILSLTIKQRQNSH